jgi:Kef-type K+ transport system membrane component KefB
MPEMWGMTWQTFLRLAHVRTSPNGTAIVVKLMTERQKWSEHGKRVMGVLLFQDLAVVRPVAGVDSRVGASTDQLARTLY